MPANLDQFLRENNINPSYSRLKILDYLIKHKNHATADRIYRDLVDELPTLSKTTVYNTLKLFQKHRLVRAIYIEDGEARFDANVDTHGHFKCEECGGIYDFSVDFSQVNVQGLAGCEVHDRELYFKGVCAQCAAKAVNVAGK